MADLVTGKALAALLNVTPMAVSLARKRGRIAFADPARKLFDRDQALRAWPNRERVRVASGLAGARATGDAAGLLAARRRREEAQAGLAELALARERRSVLDAAEVQTAQEKRESAAKARLRSIPSQIAGQVAPPGKLQQVEALIRQSIDEALTELAGVADAQDG